MIDLNLIPRHGDHDTIEYSADRIIRGLGGDPNTGMCRCPAHDDRKPSLHVEEKGGRTVFYCRAGCTQAAVMEELRYRGLWGKTNPHRAESFYKHDEEEHQRRHRARNILHAATASGRKPDDYLRGRSITETPGTAHLLSANDAERLTGKRFPAMVFPIVQRTSEDLQTTGAHVTFLTEDGSANVRDGEGKSLRLTYGTVKGGFIPLGSDIDDDAGDSSLIIGEGVETALSAMQLTGLRGVATSGTANMAAVNPPRASELLIAADNDDPGRKAANRLAERLEFEGRGKVKIVLPPDPGKDWNDCLREGEELAKQIWADALARESERERIQVSHPVEEFMDLKFPDREMLMEPWLPKPGIAMIFARAGHGKTFLALGVGFAVASGREFLGWTCERAGRVLYIDGEMPGSYLQQRLRVYGKVPAGQLHIVCRDTFNLRRELMPDLGTEAGRRVIDGIVARVKADLIIIDSLSTLVRTGEESSAEHWVPVQDWIMHHRWQGRTILLVHHAGKSGDQRGTSKRMDTPETTIKLTKQKDVDKEPDESAFELEFIKGRELFGEREEGMMLRLAIRDSKIIWRHEPKRSAVKERVRTAFADGLKSADIARELGLTKGRVSQIKKELSEEEEESGVTEFRFRV
jgi:putative DNA primase/helicase